MAAPRLPDQDPASVAQPHKKKRSKMNNRAQAAKILMTIVTEHKGLNEIDLPEEPFTRHLIYGAIRNFESLRAMVQHLLHKQIKEKDQIVFYLLIITLYQIVYSDTPEYAAINESVSACAKLDKKWAEALINKIARLAIERKQELIDLCQQELNTKYNHPFWLIKKIKRAWPEYWQDILRNNMQQAPMDLRVNLMKISREEFIKELEQNNIVAKVIPKVKTAVRLETPMPTKEIPGFDNGLFSVQDTAGQIAIELLKLKPDMKILDACAAPGSKTCHLLERLNVKYELIAIDKSAKRLERLKENLIRNKLVADVLTCDAIDFAQDSKQQFDLILLDAPCSATGVIRRHPDIKLLRNKSKVSELMLQQHKLIRALWKILKYDGRLLYTTCSVLPEENYEQIKNFTTENMEAKLINLDIKNSIDTKYGYQLLPSENNDGFFYAYLEKSCTEI